VAPTLLVSGKCGNIKTLTTDEYFQNFCREIAKKNCFIRPAAIADKVRHFMATAYRQRLIPLMTQEDSSRAAAQSSGLMPIRKLVS
jgi:peptidase E